MDLLLQVYKSRAYYEDGSWRFGSGNILEAIVGDTQCPGLWALLPSSFIGWSALSLGSSQCKCKHIMSCSKLYLPAASLALDLREGEVAASGHLSCLA